LPSQNRLIYKRIFVLKYGAAKDPTRAKILQIRTTKNSQAVGNISVRMWRAFRAECTAPGLLGILSFLSPDIFHFDLTGASVPITPYHQLYSSPAITSCTTILYVPHCELPLSPLSAQFYIYIYIYIFIYIYIYCHVCCRQYGNRNLGGVFREDEENAEQIRQRSKEAGAMFNNKMFQ